MAQPDPKRTREEAAKAEIGHTTVSRAVCRMLVVCFLVTIAVVPAGQHVHDLLVGREGEGRERVPQFYTIFGMFARSVRSAVSEGGSPVRVVFAANRYMLRDIDNWENDLDDESLLTAKVLPSAQFVLSGVLGVGNEKAYVGRDGWLFHGQGVDYLTGPGFLDAKQLARRAASGSEWEDPPQPDPRKAILRFNDQLSRRGIRLILLPVPTKAALHPDRLSPRRSARRGVLQNPSYAQFVREMTDAGIVVLDAAQAMLAARTPEPHEHYLRTDSHWRPEAMQAVAAALARTIADEVDLPDAQPVLYECSALEARNLGDLARALRLPARQRLFPPESVRLRQIRAPGGALWRPSRSADVLLLGDSFTNIYGLGLMRWGQSAGLAQQLSYELKRPVDLIVKNDRGAWRTRQVLGDLMASGRDRLAGKKVVVWQFAMRELAAGDWKVLDLNAVTAPAGQALFAPEPGASTVVAGMIRAASDAPSTRALYADHVMMFHVVDLESRGSPVEPAEAVVRMLSMKGNRLLPPARLRAGQVVRLRLRRWDDVEAEFGGLRDSELAELALAMPLCWGEVMAR